MENKITKVQKRDGRLVDFEQEKITNAIFKALTATNQGDGRRAKKLSDRVVQILNRRFKKKEIPQVEQIQDIVEEVLILEGLVEAAKAYILYREQRRRIRETVRVTEEAVERVDQYLEQLDWEVKENANMAFSLQGLNHYGVTYITKKYWLNKIYPKEIREAVESGDFHIHNLDCLACYCQGWDLYDLLLKGFRGVPGKVESNPAKHFRTALGQLVNFFYTLQGENAGAEAVSSFDTLLAPFIRYDRLNYLQVKQNIQEFLFNCAIPTRVGFQSLAAEELVVVKHKGKIKFVEIGKLIDEEFEKNSHRIVEENPGSYAVQNYDDYYTLSFNSQGRAVWARVKAFVRHKVPKDSQFLRVRTNRGEIFVSPAHSLFAFEKFNGKFNPKPISATDVKIAFDYRQLNSGNHFLALSKLVNDNNRKELDLIDLIDAIPQLQKNVSVKINPTHTLSKIRENILEKYQAIHPFYVDIGIKDKGVWKDWLKRKSIRYDIWRKFGDLNQEVKFKLKNSKIWYPRILKGEVLESFIRLCAWYIGEGHKGLSVPLYVSQADLKNKKEILKILQKLNCLGEIQLNKSYSKKGNETKDVYKIAAKGLLAEIISLSSGVLSFNKVIPWYIFNLSSSLQKIFIETLLKGEAKESENYWDLSTTSKKLSLSLSLLLAQNDIRFSVYTEKVSQKNKNWRDQYIIRIFKNSAYYGKKQYKIGDFEARVCLGKERVNYKKEYEYDISVDLPQENFIGGTGLLVFHNTPFTNITIDTKPSAVFAKQPVIIGGKPQKETYGEFQEEMNMLNQALYECMIEGDSRGRIFSFPIPTVSITKDFEWDNPALNPMWEATAKYGVNYFANYIRSDMKPEDIRALCCRLLLDKRELYNRGGGGLFGAGALTGSIGVVTIGLPRIGYLSKTKKEFFERLAKVMDLAKESLEIKRKVLENFIDKGLYPYSKFYLQGIKKMRGQYYANHFSTIGLVGMNEALLNFIGENIASKRGRRFALEVMDFMRERLVKYQKETGNIYNLEATPAESCGYKLCLKDKEKYPDIITAGTKKVPYYTNCVSEDTEILTDKGWRSIDEIREDERILTYSVKKQILEYKPILRIYKYQKEKRKMIRIQHKYVDLLLTPNHFVLYSPQGAPHKEVFTFANNLNEYFNIRVAAEYKYPENKKFSDDFLKLIGWIVSEGHFETDNAGIRLYQTSNPGYVLEIRETLKDLGINFREWKDTIFTWGKDREETSFKIPAEIGKEIREVIDKKEIPREILNEISSRQAEILIETIVKGDGTRYKTYSVINTSNPNLANQLMELAMKAGHYVAVHDYRDLTGVFHVVISNTKRRLNKHQISKEKHVKEVEYEGRVWCIETENRTIVVRRKVGDSYKYCITGNSTQLPVNYTDDLFEALKLQDELQCRYSGGTVLHLFLGERMPDAQSVKKLVKKVFENFKLPYITITPSFSICPSHGYLEGEHFFCPKCTINQPCEVYSRVVGYLRPVVQWNEGKQQEFKERKEFKLPK